MVNFEKTLLLKSYIGICYNDYQLSVEGFN